jgi:hypothetical protein
MSTPNTTRKPDTNIITIAPYIADIDLADSYDQLVNTTNTSLSSVLPADVLPPVELQATVDYRNSFKQGDTITAVNQFFKKLNTTSFKQPDFSLDAILYWYQKSSYSNKEITSYKSQNSFNNQNILLNQIPGAAAFAQNAINDANATTSYFDIVSDSIGVIANSKFIQLDSTLPLFDVDQKYYGVPIPIAASTDSKISANTRNVMYNLSQKTTMIMKRNLLNIGYTNTLLQQNLAADATTSHGLNLINDLPTFVNINKKLEQFKSALAAVYAQLKTFSFVQYLNTIGNTTALNLRDIFPVTAGDREFTVITSQQNAQASVAEAQQIKSDATAAAALAQQQYQTSVSSGNAAFGNPNVFVPGPAVTATGSSSVAPVGDKPGYNIVNQGDKQYISQQDLYNINKYNVENSGLVGYVPTDGAKYGITTGSADEWANYFTKYAPNESEITSNGLIRVNESFTESNGQISAGVFSMSVGEKGLTSTSINDPAANSAAAIQTSANLIKRDGVIAAQSPSGKWQGMAAYFGPLRRGAGQA